MHVQRPALVRALAVTALALLGAACATNRANSNDTGGVAARAVIDNYFSVLNRRELFALTAYVAPDFQWLSMVNGERFVEVDSREALAESLRKHFAQHDFFRWSVVSAMPLGDMMAVSERSEWRDGGVAQSRTTLGIFELQDGRIRRVTYFLTD